MESVCALPFPAISMTWQTASSRMSTPLGQTMNERMIASKRKNEQTIASKRMNEQTNRYVRTIDGQILKKSVVSS